MRPDPPISQRPQDILLHAQLLARVFLGGIVIVYAGDEDLAFSSIEKAEFREEERRRVRWRGGEDGGEEEGYEDGHTSFDCDPHHRLISALSP